MRIDKPVSQAEFGRLVGVTQQAVAKHMDNGVLREGATLGEWLRSYCEKLRAEASGRASDESVALTRAKTREALSKAQMAELVYHRELGNLIPVEQVEPLLQSWAVSGRAEVTRTIESVVAAIESKHEIHIERGLYEPALQTALDAIAGYPKNTDIDDDAGSG